MKTTVEAHAEILTECHELLKKKNAAYGDSWRKMRFTTILDLMIAKIDRIESLHDDADRDIKYPNESIEDNLKDILNYAALALMIWRHE